MHGWGHGNSCILNCTDWWGNFTFPNSESKPYRDWLKVFLLSLKIYLPLYNTQYSNPNKCQEFCGVLITAPWKRCHSKSCFLPAHPPWLVKPCPSYQVLVHGCGNRHTSTPWQLQEACNTSDFPEIRGMSADDEQIGWHLQRKIGKKAEWKYQIHFAA